eukprot:s662_g8.t1
MAAASPGHTSEGKSSNATFHGVRGMTWKTWLKYPDDYSLIVFSRFNKAEKLTGTGAVAKLAGLLELWPVSFESQAASDVERNDRHRG